MYVDNDVSAYSLRSRPAFERMIAAVRSGHADVIVTYATDRLYRRPRDLERIVDELQGVEVVTVMSGDVDLSTADGRAMARVVGTFAARESEKIAERVARASRERARTGRPSGGQRPFGYEPDGVTIRRAEATVIRAAYRDVLDGRSMLEVARRMNAKGSTGTRGAAWTGVTVRGMLLRPRYAGLRQHQGDVIGPATWPSIVSRETWERVRAILSDPSRRSGPGRPARALLSGILVCGRCGEPMHARKRHDTKRDREPVPIYACRSSACGRSRQRDLMDELVSEVVIARLEAEAERGRPLPAPAGADDDGDDIVEAEDLRGRIATFSDLAPQMDPADYAAAVAALRDRLATVEARIGARSGRQASAGLGLDVRKSWASADDDTRRAVLREQIETIQVGPGAPGRHGVDAAAQNLEFVWRVA